LALGGILPAVELEGNFPCPDPPAQRIKKAPNVSGLSEEISHEDI